MQRNGSSRTHTFCSKTNFAPTTEQGIHKTTIAFRSAQFAPRPSLMMAGERARNRDTETFPSLEREHDLKKKTTLSFAKPRKPSRETASSVNTSQRKQKSRLTLASPPSIRSAKRHIHCFHVSNAIQIGHHARQNSHFPAHAQTNSCDRKSISTPGQTSAFINNRQERNRAQSNAIANRVFAFHY
ncbi:hypothetical protein FHS27_004151 [Rhodopirellula rubra]|uniref:Uncharacterized protein n=1 Tax=Aporhodopirellula rubra TaxID=980271 RepID=A0A7W5E184_9BACT|nr:hypothetical protein [Aporhodopirellula rubra]